jgi:rhodanese-related sulfurtransferase
VHSISRDDLRALLAADAVTLIEALPEPHYRAEHLPGAVNLPGDLTADLAAQLAPDRTRTVVTYCSGPSCGRSKAAAAAFTRLGYPDVRVYTGGKADWADAGQPFEGTRAIPDAA